MKTVLLSLACLFGWFQARSQTKPALAVTAELLGLGTYEYGKNSCYLKLTVKNVSSANRAFDIYNCAWQWSWTISKQGLQLGPEACQCNFPEEIELISGQQIAFYGTLRLSELVGPTKVPNQLEFLASYSGVRFAFTEAKEELPVMVFSKQKHQRSLVMVSSKKKQSTTYWSNPVSLDFTKSFFYKLQAPPIDFYEVQSPPAK